MLVKTNSNLFCRATSYLLSVETLMVMLALIQMGLMVYGDLGVRNEDGMCLLDFYLASNLTIVNTFFQI